MDGGGVRTRMAAPEPKTSTLRTIVQQWAVDGVGIMIAILFFILVGIIVTVAVASSKSPWDTVIAALAMASQAFFAYVVYQLGRAQYAFTRQVADRQHKIDMYPLRKTAIENLEAASLALHRPLSISDDHADAVMNSFLEIKQLFSNKAEDLSFELYQTFDRARYHAGKAAPIYDVKTGIATIRDEAESDLLHIAIDDCWNCLIELKNIMDGEMLIR
jgi:hypothetical protein